MIFVFFSIYLYQKIEQLITEKANKEGNVIITKKFLVVSLLCTGSLFTMDPSEGGVQRNQNPSAQTSIEKSMDSHQGCVTKQLATLETLINEDNPILLRKLAETYDMALTLLKNASKDKKINISTKLQDFINKITNLINEMTSSRRSPESILPELSNLVDNYDFSLRLKAVYPKDAPSNLVRGKITQPDQEPFEKKKDKKEEPKEQETYLTKKSVLTFFGTIGIGAILIYFATKDQSSDDNTDRNSNK